MNAADSKLPGVQCIDNKLTPQLIDGLKHGTGEFEVTGPMGDHRVWTTVDYEGPLGMFSNDNAMKISAVTTYTLVRLFCMRSDNLVIISNIINISICCLSYFTTDITIDPG